MAFKNGLWFRDFQSLRVSTEFYPAPTFNSCEASEHHSSEPRHAAQRACAVSATLILGFVSGSHETQYDVMWRARMLNVALYRPHLSTPSNLHNSGGYRLRPGYIAKPLRTRSTGLPTENGGEEVIYLSQL